MGLFDKKFCDICGNKIGLLGNRKLEDGNLCKDCAKKLSPWFSERRHSTVDGIKTQLAYREENKKKVAEFTPTKTYGTRTRLMIDERRGLFMVAKTSNIIEENPDVLTFSMARGCEPVIDESRSEKKRRTSDGQYVSYNPPRYEYSYSFDVKIFVDNPFFDEIEFNISDGSIDTGETCMANANATAGWTVNRTSYDYEDGRGVQKYYECLRLGNEIKAAIERMQGGGARYAQPAAQPYGAVQYAQPAAPQYAQPAAPQYAQPAAVQYAQPAESQYARPAAPQYAQQAPVGTWLCPFCGQNNSGNFCEGCGAKRQ